MRTTMMTTTTTTTTTTLLMSCVVAILGGWSSVIAVEETPSTMPHPAAFAPLVGGLEMIEPAQKRAYTYVSEYKRLPVYNFGIGKRWGGGGSPPRFDIELNEDKRAQPYAFGVGKRARPYSFGLGKRDGGFVYQPAPSRLALNRLAADDYEGYPPLQEMLDNYLTEKRSARLYDFGLGKRVSPSEERAYVKRGTEGFRQRYTFGVGKRLAADERAAEEQDEETAAA